MSLGRYVIILSCLMLTGCSSKESAPPGNGSAPAGASPATATSPGKSTTAPAAATVIAKLDVCGLLASDDLKKVQGEAYKDAQRSDRQEGDFIVAQCYYALPTTVNSVVLNLTMAKEGGNAAAPRDFWQRTFGKEAQDKAEQREKSAKKDKDKGRGEEEGEGPKPEKVNGLGDEAFWIGSRVGGALYVFMKDQFFRISVGGAGDQNTKLNKSKSLAQVVLKKL